MLKNIIHAFLRRSRAINSAVRGRIWPNFELMCSLMVVLITCKNEEDLIKNEGARVLTTFFLYKSMFFSRCSRGANSAVLGQIWPNLKFVIDVMNGLVSCKNEEDPIKNEGARVLTTFNIHFSDAQGQLTLQSVVGFGRISYSFVLLWFS